MRKQLHVISTGQQTSQQLVEKVMAVHTEIDFIHIRERSWTASEIIDTVGELIANGVPVQKIIINDRVDVAAATEAGGVQLPAHSVGVTYVKKHHPHVRVGCSVHAVDKAIEQENKGADYLLYGHIFPTSSKSGSTPRGVESLRQMINHVSIPVIAIGGITPERAPAVLEAGAAGIAVLSGILLAEDPVAEVKKYNQTLEGLR